MNEYKFNPIKSSKSIRDAYILYMKSTFDLSDSLTYREEFERQIEKRTLYKGPYLDVTNVFDKGKSLNTLINEGLLSSEFRRLNKIYLKRTLYKHQELALRKALDNKNLIVSTGTGSGKTESFLYPIIDFLLKEVENNTIGPGVRALLLYPMNALANDQLERVREILKNYEKITFGRYTGETPEKKKEAKEIYYDMYKEYPLKNELISREQIRETPPNILFTNYSMLEYLMIRPNDKTLFMGEYALNWKFIVLDEAHVYNGASGIEVALLLRRLKTYLNKDIQYILTSATLGKTKKDYPQIVNFAKNLCNANFSEDSIVSAIRRNPVVPTNVSRLPLAFYKSVNDKDILNLDRNKLFEIMNRHRIKMDKKYENSEVKEILYHIIKYDQNYYDLLVSARENLDISLIRQNLNVKSDWEDEDLVNFIDVASSAQWNGEALFDSRYHMFIRSLEGAYVSLAPNPKIRLSRHKYIEDLVAYEIGVCKYCKSIYIIGQINDDNYFVQNEDADLLETYNTWEMRNVDYFLLEKHDDSDVDISNVEEYSLCSKCGKILKQNEVNLDSCDCGKIYQNTVYRENTNSISNKLTHCIACDGKSTANIVRQFFLGKENATTLLGQFLFNELPDKMKEVEIIKVQDDEFLMHGSDTEISIINSKKRTKQFIAFSDSRQQAAFFAGYFDAEHDRLLRKRILLDVLENNKSKEYHMLDVVNDLAAIIVKHKLFEENGHTYSESNGWITLLYELLDVDRRYSLEGLGMISFDYNIDEIQNVPGSPYFNNIDVKEYKTLIKVLLNTLRNIPAVNYRRYKSISDDFLDILDYRKYDNYVVKTKVKKDFGVGWSPRRNTNSRLDYIMKTLKMDKETALRFLDSLWAYIIKSEIIVSETDAKYRLDFKRFMIKHGEKANWYKCDTCNKVTTLNFKNHCPTYRCTGQLHLIAFDNIYKNNFYKEVYRTMPIENISIKEHTAQIDRKKATQYQKDFVEEKLNILSCSTTFEMGVDVGKLETVFLRNIPPTPANYAQRAGRAGRRVESAAYVLTYCNLSSHDFNYFDNPEKMIEGSIRPPHFVLENDKIIKRHIYAVAFGEFFIKHKEYYGDVETFMNDYIISTFKTFVTNDADRIDMIVKKFVPSIRYDEIFNDRKWIKDLVTKKDSYINIICSEYKQELNEINISIKNAKENGNWNMIPDLERLKKTKKSERIINFLSKKNVIPKYGFPVDNVDLHTNHDKANKLNRDLSVAISEYAPGSEVVVDKFKVTSRYIKLVDNYSLEKYDYYVCEDCGKLNIKLHGFETEHECDNCKILQSFTNTFIVPKYGFLANYKVEKAKTRKPKKTYSGDVYYVGKGRPIEYLEYEYRNVNIRLESSGNDELVVMNETPFYICSKCGYTEIDTNYPVYLNLDHKRHNGKQCSNKSLERFSLGHNFKTDVVKVEFFLPIKYDQALSVLYALLEGVSSYLDIERNDIAGVIVKNSNTGSYDFILFDHVPGGAGHVKRLMDSKEFSEVLIETRRLMTKNCCDPETSCYSCLRNYYNQKLHHKLKRKHVIDFFDNFLT